MAKRITIGGVVKDGVIRDLAQALTTIGYKVALDAYRKARHGAKIYTHRTYNLQDSYGSAVFINGELVRDSIRFVQRGRSTGGNRHGHRPTGKGYELEIDGRQSLSRFFENMKGLKKTNSVTVIVAAAMWYAELVQSKGYEVLDTNYVKKELKTRINSDHELFRRMKEKYGLDSATVKAMLGVDEEYYENRDIYDRMSNKRAMQSYPRE